MNNRFTIVNKFVRNRLVADFILLIFATSNFIVYGRRET